MSEGGGGIALRIASPPDREWAHIARAGDGRRDDIFARGLAVGRRLPRRPECRMP